VSPTRRLQPGYDRWSSSAARPVPDPIRKLGPTTLPATCRLSSLRGTFTGTPARSSTTSAWTRPRPASCGCSTPPPPTTMHQLARRIGRDSSSNIQLGERQARTVGTDRTPPQPPRRPLEAARAHRGGPGDARTPTRPPPAQHPTLGVATERQTGTRQAS